MAAAVAAAMMATACGGAGAPAADCAQFQRLPSQGWPKQTPLEFAPEFPDSTLAYDLYLALRHNSRYTFDGIGFDVEIVAADGSSRLIRAEIGLADSNGNWTSSGFGPLYQATCPLSRAVAPVDAKLIKISHAMDADPLTGVTEIGLLSRESEKNSRK